MQHDIENMATFENKAMCLFDHLAQAKASTCGNYAQNLMMEAVEHLQYQHAMLTVNHTLRTAVYTHQCLAQGYTRTLDPQSVVRNLRQSTRL